MMVQLGQWLGGRQSWLARSTCSVTQLRSMEGKHQACVSDAHNDGGCGRGPMVLACRTIKQLVQ